MPTYDYVCDTCQQQFEIFQSMKDKALTKCPDKKCRGRVKRLMGTGAGLIFKGSGFYVTDYRSESYKSAARTDATAASAPAASSGESTKVESPKKEAVKSAAPATAPSSEPKKSGPKAPKAAS